MQKTLGIVILGSGLLDSAAAQIISLDNGTTFDCKYNTDLQMVQYDVVVAPGSYFAIGYGSSMTDTDMVQW